MSTTGLQNFQTCSRFIMSCGVTAFMSWYTIPTHPYGFDDGWSTAFLTIYQSSHHTCTDVALAPWWVVAWPHFFSWNTIPALTASTMAGVPPSSLSSGSRRNLWPSLRTCTNHRIYCKCQNFCMGVYFMVFKICHIQWWFVTPIVRKSRQSGQEVQELISVSGLMGDSVIQKTR